MWIKGTTRKEFLDIILAKRSFPMEHVRHVDSLPLALDSSSELHLLWRENPHQQLVMPSAVLIDQGRRRDFLAWAIEATPLVCFVLY